MSFVDRIADARDIAQVFDLVNEFISAMEDAGEIGQMRSAVRPGRINTADDLSYWFGLASEEISRRDNSEDDTPIVVFALHVVLETA